MKTMEEEMSVTAIKQPAGPSAAKDWLMRQIERAKFSRSVQLAVDVGPDLARACLELNGPNRRISRPHVRRLSADMLAGNWGDNHAGLAFDRNGRLLDGQHRLSAIRESGVTVKMDFHFGIDPSAFDRIDINLVRSTANMLQIRGNPKYATLVGATASILMSLKRDLMFVDRNISKHAILEFIDQEQEIIPSVEVASKIRNALGRMHSPAGFSAGAFLIRRRMGAIESEPFFDKMRTGVGFQNENDPIHRLRQKLSRIDRGVFAAMEVTALTIKAFNFWHEGRTIQSLVWRQADEAFPRVGE